MSSIHMDILFYYLYAVPKNCDICETNWRAVNALDIQHLISWSIGTWLSWKVYLY